MPTIYIDMDGVLADFDTRMKEIMDLTPEDWAQHAHTNRWPNNKWKRVRDLPHYFRDLPKMARADQLMDLAYRFRDTFGWRLRALTAVPHDNDFPECFQDKIDWMREHYPDLRVWFGPYSEDKQMRSQPGDILIDDRRINIEQWENRGGTGIHVTKDYELALTQLRAIFDQRLRDRDSSQNPD
jgi:5'(3')-deoxyribonucleotidase